MTRRFVLLLFAIALLGAMFFFLPKTKCCDDSNPEIEHMTDRASAGDLDSIRILYQHAQSEGVHPMVEHWALEGALYGDRHLRAAYVEMFNSRFDSHKKGQVIKLVRSRASLPGATCLEEQLIGHPSKPECSR